MDTVHGSELMLPSTTYWAQALELRWSALTRSPNVHLDDFYAETRAMEEILRRFRSRWTTVFSPVHKLPAEILSIIFEMLAFSGTQWEDVTRVCGSWRTVATNNPALWTRFHLSTETRWDLFVARARGRPLTVYYLGKPVRLEQPRLALALVRDFHHIESFRVYSSQNTADRHLEILDTVFDRLGWYDAQQLHDLMIKLDRTKDGAIKLSEEFFSDIAISLRSVELHCSPFPWGTTAPNLTRLSLHRVIVESPYAFCEGLKKLTSLEYLSLNIREFEEADEDAHPSTVMRNLREVHLMGSVSNCCFLVDCLLLSTAAHLDILVREDDETINLVDLDDLIATLRSRERGRLADSDYTTVKASVTEDMFELQVLTNNDPELQSQTRPDLSPGLRVRIPNSDSLQAIHPELDDLFDDISAALDKSQWRDLRFSGAWSGLLWWNGSPIIYATGLEMLCLESVPRKVVDSVLSNDLLRGEEKLPIDGAEILFPVLRSLSLEDISFGCYSSECDGYDALPHCLVELLEVRKEAGYPISALTIKHCSLARGYGQLYAPYVEHYSWDGEVGDAHDRHSQPATSDDDEDDTVDDVEDESEEEDESEGEGEGEGEDEDECGIVTRS
ncbi:unnamed protein product [Peniophora sp. CBMAI 1063]|nr:unnamed protein product [Peniophora sp. CBMAI 1063]